MAPQGNDGPSIRAYVAAAHDGIKGAILRPLRYLRVPITIVNPHQEVPQPPRDELEPIGGSLQPKSYVSDRKTSNMTTYCSESYDVTRLQWHCLRRVFCMYA